MNPLRTTWPNPRSSGAPWHPQYPALAARAKLLGWYGAGSLWDLCAWAGVSSRNLAGPESRAGIARAISEISEIVAQRWGQHVARRQVALGLRAGVADAARAAALRFAAD